MEELEKPHHSYYLPTKAWIGSLVGIVFVILFVHAAAAPAEFPSGGIVSIEPNESLKTIARTLKDEGYIRSPFVFINLIILFGGERHIAPGGYYFPYPRFVSGVAWQIARGSHNLEPVKVTVPEGENAREIAALLSQKLPGFLTSDFLQLALANEGYLYPETYFLYPKTSPETVVAEMKALFDVETAAIWKDTAVAHSKRDVVIMASLIEREAHGNDDRATISGILWNRLSRGMPLQVDATVAYAAAISESQLSKKDFGIDSPYNTYLYRGLPPAAISNPGMLALEAAAHPAKTPYLYYLHDRHGTIHYAKTYAEHQANVAKYLK